MAGTERKGLFKRLTEALFEDVETPTSPPPVRPPPSSSEALRRPADEPEIPNPLPADEDQADLWEAAMAQQRLERTAKAQAAFEGRLTELTEEQKPGSAGKMSLFGLEDIKAELGDRWESMAERARLVAEQVISRRMAPNDVYAPFDEDSFLILFADLSEEQAAIKLMVIANEIHERLLGEVGLQNRHWVRSLVSEAVVVQGVQPPRTLNEFNLAMAGARDLGFVEPTQHRQTPSVGVRDNAAAAAAARVKLEEKVELAAAAGKNQTAGKMQFLDIERIRSEFGDRWRLVADKAQTIVENVIRARIGPADVMAPYSDDSYLVLFAELDEPHARLKTQAIAREIRERLLGELQLEEGVKAFVVEVPEERPPGNVLDWLNRTVSASLDIAPKKAGKTEDGAAVKRAGEISACYRPTLFAAKSVISIHDCHPLRMIGDGVQSGVHAYPPKDPAVTFEIDRTLLEQGLLDLHAMIKRGKAGVIQIPIHAGSMLAHSNFMLIDLVRSLHPDERKYLVLDLMGIEATGLMSRLPEIISTLHPFCRAISARVSLDFHDFDALARLGVAVVGSDLEAVAVTEGLRPRIERFIAGAQRSKQSIFLFGVHDIASVTAYKAMGAAYLNGRAISRASAHPHGVYPWTPPRAARQAPR